MTRAVTFISGGAILIALLGTVEWHIAQSSSPVPDQSARERQEKRYDRVTALVPIRRGTRVEPEMLGVAGETAVPEAGTFSATEQAVGRVALADLEPRTALGTYNTTNNSSGIGLSPLIPKGMRATTIRVSDEIAVGNWIQAGDRVDVLLIGTSGLRSRGSGQNVFREGEARILLQNVTVLAVGDSLVGEPSNNRTYRTVTLAVTPRNAVLMALAGSVGTYHLSLRARDDSGRSRDFVVKTDDFVSSAAPKPDPEGTTSATKPRTVEIIVGKKHDLVPVEDQP